MGIMPFMAFYSIERESDITDKRVFILSTSCRRKLLRDGRIRLLSPCKCYGIVYLAIGYGRVERCFIVYKVEPYIDDVPEERG